MKSQFGRAVVGGLAGTIAMTLMMMFVAPMMGVHMDIAKNLADMMGSPHAAGLAVHIFNGTVLFPAIFAFALLRFLPGTTLVKGLIWGGILWAMLEILVMPMMGMGAHDERTAGPGEDRPYRGTLEGHTAAAHSRTISNVNKSPKLGNFQTPEIEDYSSALATVCTLPC